MISTQITSDTVESVEATTELDKSKTSKTSFEMAMDHTSLNMPTGMKLGKCYQVESNLGEGTFGFVCKCRNIETGKMVAIKVNKNQSDVISDTKDEIAILKKLRRFDPDTCNIIQWNGFFFDKDRICLNFELLDLSLLDYMECADDDGLPMTELKPIIYQLATALSHLRSIGIVHSDLKPDNVMIVDRTQQPLRVKLIDFGVALSVSALEPGDILQPIWYRAPEVIIGLPLNEAIDMWSLGLLAVELAAGPPLYPGDEDYDVLNLIIQVQGQPADDMLDHGKYTKSYFNKENNSQQRWRFKTPEEFANETGYHSMDTSCNQLMCLDDLQEEMAMTGEIKSDQCLLMDLIKRMLELDSDKRIKPLEVLQHPFFETTKVIQQSSWNQTAGPENIDCGVEGSCVSPCKKIMDNAGETTEITQQSSWNQTAGPENIDCNDDVSYYKTKKKKNRRKNIVLDVSQQSSWNQTTETENIHCRVESLTVDTSDTVESEEATPELDKSKTSKTSFAMAMDHTSLNMPTGMKLGKCYQVESNLGEGNFGFVCKCRNIETGKMVAIKVNKNQSDVISDTKDEIAILKKLRHLDPDTCNIIQWNGFFFDKDRICLNFELLDLSLFDYMEDMYNDGLPMTELKPIIYQLATALSHLGSIGIVHSDLKSDNVMIVDRTQQPLRVKLIDFGVALSVSALEPDDIVQPICYRAPEVIIGLPLNEAIDMWSLGLLAAEVATGLTLYPGHEKYDVLNLIIQVQGQPADDVLDRGEHTELYFNKENNSQQRWRFKTPEEFANETDYHSMDTSCNELRCLDDLQEEMSMTGEIKSDQCLLVDLIKRMLELDPDKRIKPLEVLQHPFFETTEVTQQSSWNQTAGPENIDCGVESSCVSPCKKIMDNAGETTEITQQSSWNQTAGPENIDCNDNVSYYKTKKKKNGRKNIVLDITQQSSWNQMTEPENIHCRVERPPADTSDTVESEEATPELEISKTSKTSFEMAMDHTSLNMPTGMKLGKCYQVESNLGEGTFGFVCKCRNIETGKMVAIKVNKNQSDVISDTKDEIAILKKLRHLDPDTCNIIQWNGFFFDKDRICLNFELLDLSLFDYMECADDDGLPMTELKPIIYQLATALSHLRSIGIVHSDLKPDNVMIVDRTQQPLRVKLIDFGVALSVSALEPGDILQPIWYRAPEVIIGLPLNEAIDMWSLGLLAVELAAGPPLYPGDEDYDVLNLIIQVQGQPADDMLDRGKYTKSYFNKENNSHQRWRFKTPEEFAIETGYHSMDTSCNQLMCLDDLQEEMAMTGEIKSDQCLLVDLIERMLELDPDKRIKPLEVLQHPLFETTEVIQQSSWNQTAGPENIDCGVESSCVSPCKKIMDNAGETTEVTQQSSWNQTAGPANIDCGVESSCVSTCKKIMDNAGETTEVTQQSSWNQTTETENIHCRVESLTVDTSDTVESEEATPELDKSKTSKTSFAMAMDHTSLNMPTGMKLGKCYQVESNLGEGTFGFVCKCRNIETGKMVAIKVNKNQSDVISDTKDEIAILKKLRHLDPDTCNIIQWNGFFFDKDRICLNFELLDLSLLDYMECADDDGLPMTELKPIIYQLATALSHLRSIGIVHSDLKPDNVMIVDRTQQPLRVKLIDFGVALSVSALEPGDILQPIWYRAPEVIIGLPLNEAIDMWSLGLLAVELAAGPPLYPGDEDYDVLNLIIQVQGQPADDMLDRGKYTKLYFNKENNSHQRWRFKTPEEFANETGYHSMDTSCNQLMCLDDLQEEMAMTGEIKSDQCLLMDLIKRMLELDSDKRVKPLEVLQHPFFETTEVIQQSSWNQTAGPENIDCGVESSCVSPCKKIMDNAGETTEITQQSSWNQTAGPENIDCNDDVSYYKTKKKKNRRKNIVLDVTQQSSWNQTTETENIHCRVESPTVDTSDTVESEEAIPELDKSKTSKTSFEMAMDHTSLNMPTGMKLGKCYQVESNLGEGTFGFVCKCRNIETGKMVAIKVNKNQSDVISDTKDEIAILKKLQHLDPDTCNIIQWNGFFFDKDRICLNFELLDLSLFDYMEHTYNDGLPMTELKPIIYQLATALSHLGSIGIVHSDLKSDNVMIVDRTQQPLRVKLIDFGVALSVSALEPDDVVQPICYRAPEVIIGLPLNEAIDMWSLGLLVAEVATGLTLYPGDEEYDVLNLIIQVQGQPADDVLDRGEYTESYFNKENNSQQCWRFKTPEEFANETGYHSMDTSCNQLRCLDDLQEEMAMTGEIKSDQCLLVDLIERMLELDPDKRIKPLEVLQHPFFETTEVTQQSSWNQTAGPENIDCNDNDSYYKKKKKKNRRKNIALDVTQQSSWNQTAGPENIHCGVESPPAERTENREH